MKKTTKISTLAALTLSLLCSIVLPSKTYAVTNTTFDQNITTIPITRNVTGVSNPVTNTFTYTITADANNPGTVTNAPTSATIVFNATSPSTNTATESSTIDFSGATFSSIGDYYFTVEETGSTDSSLYPLDSTIYTAQVSVRYAVGAGNVTDPDTHVVTLVQTMENASNNKVAATWTYASPRTYFEISATTVGNSADVSKCFAYTLNIPVTTGISATDTFDITTTSTCSGNQNTITAGTNTTIYLKNGDTMTVGQANNLGQLPVGSGYTIALNDADGYDVEYNGADVAAPGTATQTVSNLVAQNDANFATSNNSNYKLTRHIPVTATGIVTNVLVYVAIFGVGATGLIYASKKSSSRK